MLGVKRRGLDLTSRQQEKQRKPKAKKSGPLVHGNTLEQTMDADFMLEQATRKKERKKLRKKGVDEDDEGNEVINGMSIMLL